MSRAPLGRLDDASPVITPQMTEVLEAVESIDLDARYEEVAPAFVPLLPRRRPLPDDMDGPVRLIYPPGIDVSFGVDIGPAFWYLSEPVLERWEVTAADVAERALANIRERCEARRQFGLIREVVADVPVIAFQSREGWASGLLLLPDQLERVFGPKPALILAPMRDVIFRLPLDADREFAHWFTDEIAALDMNALDVPQLTFVDGTLRFDVEAVGAPAGFVAQA